MRNVIRLVMAGLLSMAMSGIVSAADSGSREEAVALVKKAIDFIKANGRAKAFAEFSNTKGQFVDRDLYITVYDMDCKCLAHGSTPSKVGRDMTLATDVDGKPYYKERVELMKKSTSTWQDFKHRNPVTNKVERKSMYSEKFEDVIVSCGVYNKH